MQNNRWLSTTGTSSSSRTSSIHEDQQQFFASKEECHLKSIKTFDDWEYVIKSLSKTSLVHDDTLKTAKLFTQVDSLSKNTKNSIEKTSKTLDQLLDKKLSILAAVKNFNDIKLLLDINAITRKHWISEEE